MVRVHLAEYMPNLNAPPPTDSDGFERWLTQFYQTTGAPPKYWQPALSFATPGDSLIVLSRAHGEVVNNGGIYTVQFDIVTSTFTHTTSAGALSMTGLPFTANPDTSYVGIGTLQWAGITKANYTQWGSFIVGATNVIQFLGNGSGVSNAVLASADMPTAGVVTLRGTLQFR